LVVEGGNVKEAFVEPDNTGLDGMFVIDVLLRGWMLTEISFGG
jgi:hypothetical protein